MHIARIGGLVAVFLVTLASHSAAEPIAYRFSGTLTSDPYPSETRPSLLGLTAGSRFYGTMGLDFNLPPLPERSGRYEPYLAGQRTESPTAYFSLWYTLTFDTLTIAQSNLNQLAIVSDLTDTFVLLGRQTSTSDASVTLSEVSPRFQFAPDTFSGTSFPQTLDPASFLSGNLWLSIYFSNGVYDQSGTIDTLEVAPVPEAPSWTFLITGLAVFVPCRRIRWPARLTTS